MMQVGHSQSAASAAGDRVCIKGVGGMGDSQKNCLHVFMWLLPASVAQHDLDCLRLGLIDHCDRGCGLLLCGLERVYLRKCS